jgi:short-subunit dehydrogenase
MSYQGKVVWLTGASSGIGEALAYELAARGATLALSARRADELERVRARCVQPEAHTIVPLDLADWSTFSAKAAEVEARFGRIDILFNNAGISQRSLARDTSIDVDRRLMEVNYLGTVALTKAVLPSMLRRKGGHIVTITSVAGKLGTPMRSGYAASKHALHGFFDSLRAEIWRENVRVSLVCPGFIKTNLPMVALTGDGSPQGKMDNAQAKGMEPADFARRTLDALAGGRDEVVVGGAKEHMAAWLKRLAPALLARALRTAKVV